MAKTEKGKEIRKYYVKLENIFNEIITEERSEYQKQLKVLEKDHQHSQQLLVSTEVALQESKEKYSKMIQRRYNKVAPTQTLYVYKDIIPQIQTESTENLYEIKLERDYVVKIGKTKSLADREIGYNTHNFTGEIAYAKKCQSSDLLEKVVHFMFKGQRLIAGREWFNVSVELAIEMIDYAQLLLDELPVYSETLLEFSPASSIRLLLDKVKTSAGDQEEEIKDPGFKNVYDIFKENEEMLLKIPNQELIAPHITAKNALDFDNFINECCEKWTPDCGILEKDFYCLSADLRGAHKLWSRNAETPTTKALTNYMKNYKTGIREYIEYNAKLLVYIGIKIKPLQFTCNNTEFLEFVNERCKIGYTCRVAYRSIFDEFVNWKQEQIPDYSMSMETKHSIQNLLNIHFYPCGVHLSDKFSKLTGVGTNSNGVYGITLKSDTTNTGIKLAPTLKKKVIQIDLVTKQIINTFNSVLETAKALKVVPSVISTDIKYERVRHNTLLKFSN